MTSSEYRFTPVCKFCGDLIKVLHPGADVKVEPTDDKAIICLFIVGADALFGQIPYNKQES